ncbi:MAG: mcpB 3 [Paenibacillaceae bacterium]|jgi:methyl-accepting chemotaxis protein|nr:mcpB 3 [Paenibacillaceae bacterium]
MRITRLNTKLLLLLLPCFLVSLGLLSGISFYLSQQSLSSSMKSTAEAVGTDYANRIESYIREAIVQSTAFADMPGMRETANLPALVQALANNKSNSQYLESSVFIFPDGSAVRSDGTTLDLGDRTYFQQVMSTGEAVVSELLLSRTTGKLAFNVAVPVKKDGQTLGVMTGSFANDKLGILIGDLKFLSQGYGFLADAAGQIIVHPRMPELSGVLNLTEAAVAPELNMKEKELDESFIQLFKSSADTGEQTRGDYVFIDGIRYSTVFTPFNLPGGQRWIMMVTAPFSELNQGLTELTRSMLTTAALCLVAAAAAIVFISRRIAKPVAILRDECMLLMEGDFREQPLRVVSNDEIGQLASGFQEMRNKLRQLVAQVHFQAEHVAASSEELTASAQQAAEAVNVVADSYSVIAQNADTQAAASSILTTLARDMAENTNEIAGVVDEAATIALEASRSARDGQATVGQTVSHMQEVGKGTVYIDSAMTSLSKDAEEISEIASLISSISSQTNLLALNAAIEAARAGEHGRGFAVVSGEIRKLAEEAGKAAQQIAALISRNQTNTSSTVDATRKGLAATREAIEMVSAAGTAFETIAASIVQLSGQMEHISEAIGRITGHSRQLAASAGEVDSASKTTAAESETASAATQEQAATMEEVAASSEALAAMAADLREAAAKFRV